MEGAGAAPDAAPPRQQEQQQERAGSSFFTAKAAYVVQQAQGVRREREALLPGTAQRPVPSLAASRAAPNCCCEVMAPSASSSSSCVVMQACTFSPAHTFSPVPCVPQVLPGLHLGSREAEANLQLLTDRGITHILQAGRVFHSVRIGMRARPQHAALLPPALQVAYEVLPSHDPSRFVYQVGPRRCEATLCTRASLRGCAKRPRTRCHCAQHVPIYDMEVQDIVHVLGPSFAFIDAALASGAAALGSARA